MTNQSKNPVFWSVGAFAAGMGLGIWGWHKSESDHYVGSTAIIVLAVVLIIGGVIGMFSFGKKQ